MNWKFWKKNNGKTEDFVEKKVIISGEEYHQEYIEKVVDEWRDRYIIN